MSRLKVNQIIPFNDFGLGIGAANSKASAILNIQSTTQGVLFPSMTTVDRDAIPAPWDGLFIYNTDSHAYEHYSSFSSSWESVDGIQLLNGLSAKIQTFANGTAGFAPNWTTTGGNTHVLNLPYAHSIAVTGGLVTKGEWDSFNTRLYPVRNILYVVKNVILGPQDFNSVKEAVDSITDASATNPYLVLVGPGVFTESPIVMQPYVWVEGAEQDQTVIQPSNSANSIILAAPNSGISKLLLTGSLGVGVGAILYQSATGSDQTSFFAENIRFGNNDTHVVADSTDSQCSVFIEEGRLGGLYQFNTGFVARNGGKVVVRNTTTTSVAMPVPSDVFVGDGVGSEIVINAAQLRNGNATAGNCIRLRDGARLRALSLNLKNWSKAVWVENIGAPCFVDVVGILCEGNTADLQIDQPTTDGTFAGSADHTKIIVDVNSPLGVVIVSNKSPSDTTGSVTVGTILQGDRYDRLANLSKLAREATTLGDIDGGDLSVNSGLDIDVTAGSGFLLDPTFFFINEVSWNAATVSLPADSTSYIFIDTNSTVQFAASLPSLQTVIPLGRVVTGSSFIKFIEDSPLSMQHYGNQTEEFLRTALGAVFTPPGAVTTESTTPFELDVTASNYFFGAHEIHTAGGTSISWTSAYRDGVGGWTELTENTISNSLYDNGSGTLVSIPSNKYATHFLYVVGQPSGSEKYFLVYAQQFTNSLADAKNASLPLTPPYFTDALVAIAAIVVQQGMSPIEDVSNISPRIGFAARAASTTSDHGALSGLLDDDHPQYLLVSGARAMSGPLNMGTNNITNVGTVNGVTVEAHASRHFPTGADALATAAPVSNLSAITTNDVGTANSFARSDHSHAINTGVAVTLIPDQVNSAGGSANLSRADHVHNIPTAAPGGTIGANSVNGQGVAASFSRSDHAHQLATGSPATITPDNANAPGVSNNLSRADHIHAIATAVPVSVSTANAQGASSAFARADHVHAHGIIPGGATHDAVTTLVNGYMSAADKVKLDGIATGATNTPLTSSAPANVTKAAAVVGVSTEAARADHKHDIDTATASTLTPDLANAEGSATSLSRSDHIHNIPTASAVSLDANSVSAQGAAATFARSNHTHAIASGTPSTQTPDQANATGTSANFARADHIHAIATAAASTLTPDLANAQGSATSFSRSDHIHNIPTAAPVTIGTANAIGAAASFARSDHVHSHGAQTSPTQHAVATAIANGFMSSTDKSKLDGISGTRIFKAGQIAAVTFAGNPKKATVTFSSAFPDTNYSISIVGVDQRSWSYESKLAGSFVINAHANTALTGEVSWTAISNGETLE